MADADTDPGSIKNNKAKASFDDVCKETGNLEVVSMAADPNLEWSKSDQGNDVFDETIEKTGEAQESSITDTTKARTDRESNKSDQDKISLDEVIKQTGGLEASSIVAYVDSSTFDLSPHYNRSAANTINTLTPVYILNPSILNLTPTEVAQFQEHMAWFKKMEEQAKRGPFHLMDLPAEMRNNVYEHVFKNEFPHGQSLSRFKLPTIRLASKAVHKECLPLFFASAFYIESRSNFEDRMTVRTRRNKELRGPSTLKEMGRMNMKRPGMKLLEKAGTDMLIKDITLKIRSAEGAYWFWMQNDLREPDWETTAYVRLYTVNSVLRVSVEEGTDHPNKRGHGAELRYRPHESEDIDAAIEDVKKKALEIGKREGFKGLKWRDVENIVKQLRYKPAQ